MLNQPEISQRPVLETIRGTALNCMKNLTYTRHPSKTMWGLIDGFHKNYGQHPTFEQVKGFNDENKGINCSLYVEAAVDLLRSQGVTANLVNILDPFKSKGPEDNHAVVFAADKYFMDPQTGEIFDLKDWASFAKRFAPLLETTPEKLVAYSPIEQEFIHTGNYTVIKALDN